MRRGGPRSPSLSRAGLLPAALAYSGPPSPTLGGDDLTSSDPAGTRACAFVARRGSPRRIAPVSVGDALGVGTGPDITPSRDGPPDVRLGPSAAGRCPRRIHLDAARPEARPGPSTGAQRALTELIEHRRRVLLTVRGALGELVAVPCDLGDPASADRLGPVVVGPRLAAGVRSGAPDVLVWADDGYVPVIIRAHRTLQGGRGAQCSPVSDPSSVQLDPGRRARRNRSDTLALAHHYRQLTDLGWAAGSPRGGVIGLGGGTEGDADDDAVIVWYDLDMAEASVLVDYDRRFADRLNVARAAAAGGELAWPSRIAECRRCPWWPECSAELAAAGDVSLLVIGPDAAALRAAGVRTVDELADLPAALAGALRLHAGSAGQARVRARAWQRGVPLVRIGQGGAVKRADVELDVDSESYGQDGAYLWGTYLSGADVGLPQGYRPFATWQPLPSAAEGEIFVDFYRYLQQVGQAAAARGRTFAAFCFARAAEERWMRTMPRRHPAVAGMPSEREVAAFCGSAEWVDVHAELKRLFVPTGSLRLKSVAAALGFSWRDPEPGGENSMAWYLAGVDPAVGPPSGRGDESMKLRVLHYNEDDVRATLAVRRWLSENGGALPTAAELAAAPSFSPGSDRPWGSDCPSGSDRSPESPGITAGASGAHRPTG